MVLMAAVPDGGAVSWDGGLPPLGTWWVVARGHPVTHWGRDAEREAVWLSTCTRMEVEQRRVTLDDVTFTVLPDGGLGAPRVESRRRRTAVASGSCRAGWPASARTFATEADCQAELPPRLAQRCVGDAGCSWDFPPLELGACDDELARLRERLAVATALTDAEAFATLQRLEAVLDRGGRLYLLEGDACQAVTVKPRRDGLTSLSVTSDAGRWELLSLFEPVFGQAVNYTEIIEDARGTRATSGPVRVELLLGKDRVLLGAQTFWFSRRCR